jgi:glyoxylase-like metal-dependent hydrolase (beta-lactamase superfamily II)
MLAEHVNGNVYIIDAPFHGESGVLGTYVVKGETALVVDPGPTVSIPHVVRGLEALGVDSWSLKRVALTHIHLDHACGSWKLLERYPYASLYVHPRGSGHMIDPSKLEEAARSLFEGAVNSYGEIRGVPSRKVVESQDGEVLNLGGATVNVLWTPGHSAHHQSFFVPEDEVIIVGDAGGFYTSDTGVIMPTTPPPFNPASAVDSLDKLIALGPRYICYGHFGFSEGAIEKLEAHKRQIILWSRIVGEGLEEGLGLREIYEMIRTEDPMAEKDGGFSEDMKERSSFINLQGFVKYHEWIKQRGK